MSEPTATEASERRAALLTMVACAVVVASAVLVALLFGAPKEEGKGKILTLTASEHEGEVRCAPVTPETLRDAPIAFSGTVVEVEDDKVVLEAHHWFAGEEAEEVVIETSTYGYLHDLALIEDNDYLIASGEGEVGTCTGSGEQTHARVIAFDEAFDTDE